MKKKPPQEIEVRLEEMFEQLFASAPPKRRVTLAVSLTPRGQVEAELIVDDRVLVDSFVALRVRPAVANLCLREMMRKALPKMAEEAQEQVPRAPTQERKPLPERKKKGRPRKEP